MSALVAIVLALVTLLPTSKGVENIDYASELVALSSPMKHNGRGLHAFARLQDGQTVRLRQAKLTLKRTVHIRASNVEVAGARDRTQIRCPKRRAAFIVRGTNVTLRRLEFTGCTNSSAVFIYRDYPDWPPCIDIGETDCAPRRRNGKLKQKVLVDSCAFRNNERATGAVVFVRHARLLILNSIFLHNRGYRGGAIYAVQSSLSIKNTSFDSNSAVENGGAVTAFTSKIKIVNVSVSENYADEEGGAMWFRYSNLTVENIVFTGNWANQSGGAFHVHHCMLIVKACQFYKNSVYNGDGTIDARDSDVTVEDAMFADNFARYGGGALDIYDSNSTVKNSKFFNNSAIDGAAVEVIWSNLTLENVAFTANRALTDGGVLQITWTDAILKVAEFSNNSGSAIATFGSYISVQNSDFFNNSNSAIYSFGSNISLRHSTFNQHSVVWVGGALHVRESAVKVGVCEFNYNSAYRGGAIYAEKSNITAENATFVGNSAVEQGGGLYLETSHGVLRNSEFIDNAADNGGTFFNDNSTMKTHNVTVSGNSTKFLGMIFYLCLTLIMTTISLIAACFLKRRIMLRLVAALF